MANTDNPFGFQLLTSFNTNFAQYYPIVTAYGTSIFRGDLVGADADIDGLVCGKLDGSTRPELKIIATGVAGEVFGVVIGTYDSDMLPQVYHVASAVGDGVVAGYLLTYTDPNALYLVQEDGDTTPIPAASAGMNCDAISTHAGNTLTGRSKMELDSSSEAATATLATKLIRSWEADTVASAYCRWVVKINAAAMGANVASPE
jgi:hypothetical protein